ncbi:MAG: RHS repeat-associated core domain-containing protein [Actinomycetota bacterium]|nr:RHS repeat-associated core domain-containing protein [Actinomycetota bacterium]
MTRSPGKKYYYDGNGNITHVEKIGSTENHAYDAANQCTDNGFTYDECGNLTSDGEWDYEYERGSRLVSATNDTENLKVAFSYDPQGKRYSKTAYERDGQGQYTVEKYARFYHYDSGGNILCETDAAGNIIRSYAYDLSGHPIAFTQDLGQGQRTFYVHTNARGDVTCITDDAMDWVKKLTYDPWGNITSETAKSSEYEALSCPYAYAGYFRDTETGLYFMPARYYSPVLRRFLTKDPHPGSKSQPITLNPYQYCKNNPVNKVDPSGQYDLDAIMSGLSGLSGLSSALEASLSQIAAGAALIRGGGLQAASFASSMSSFRSSVASSMSNMGGMVARISSGISQAVAGVSGLARFNWGGLASVGIRGGRTPEQAASDHETILEEMRRNPNPWPQSNDPRNIVQKVVDAVFFNPITRIGVGVAGIVVSALSIPVTFGLSLKGIWYSARIIDFAVQDIQDGNWAGNPYHHMP